MHSASGLTGSTRRRPGLPLGACSALLASVLACGGVTGSPTTPPAATATPSAPHSAANGESGSEPQTAAENEAPQATPALSASATQGNAAAEPVRASAFPPAAFTPPFPATAKPGDGTWTPLGDATLGELAALPPHTLYRSSVHPHERNGFMSMDVVAIDLRALRLGWVIGSKDQDAVRLSKVQTPGLIPVANQPHAVAVFNGGFQARHGWWGMQSDGIVIVPPKPQGCTVALFRDGKVKLGPWVEFEAEAGALQAARQGPPCLLHDGAVHPALLKGNVKMWAGQNADLKTRRRSAAGLSADGLTLYFAIGTETQAVDLARGLLAAGAADALQLDINWAWARLLLAGKRDGQPRLTSSLMPEALYGKNECFTRPSERDFFYLWQAQP